MNVKYSRQLSAGANNAVIALSETEAAKLYVGDTRSDIGSEAEKLKFANGINNLVCRFVRLDYHENLQAEILVMERIYPVDYRAYELEKRELWYDVLVDELSTLHKAGFVHRDIRRPSGLEGQYFDNVLLTSQGLRLIDVGIPAIKGQVGEKLFAKYVTTELQQMEQFKTYFLNR